jgi:hypothetical protein
VSIVGSFGRPGFLGDQLDDLAPKVDAWVKERVIFASDTAYDEIKARIKQDVDDRQLLERAQDLKYDAQKKIAITVVGAVIATSVATWALVTYVRPSRA